MKSLPPRRCFLSSFIALFLYTGVVQADQIVKCTPNTRQDASNSNIFHFTRLEWHLHSSDPQNPFLEVYLKSYKLDKSNDKIFDAQEREYKGFKYENINSITNRPDKKDETDIYFTTIEDNGLKIHKINFYQSAPSMIKWIVKPAYSENGILLKVFYHSQAINRPIYLECEVVSNDETKR